MRWAGHVALWGREQVYIEFWWGDLRERDHLEDQGAEWKMILKCIFIKWGGEAWTGLIWLRIKRVAGTCECGDEPSGSIKFLD
jgi:hypothetical protein